MTTLVITLAIAATVATVAWFNRNRQYPERAATDQLGGDRRPPT